MSEWWWHDCTTTTYITSAQTANCMLMQSDCHLIYDVWQAALKRLQLEYVDLVFCHRPDPFTPIEETVRAMNFVIEQGWAFYWGTSEWSGQQITEVIVQPQSVVLPCLVPSVAWLSTPSCQTAVFSA